MSTSDPVIVYKFLGRAMHKSQDEELDLATLGKTLYKATHWNQGGQSRERGIRKLKSFIESQDTPRGSINQQMISKYPVRNLDETNSYEIAFDGWGTGLIEVYIKGHDFTHVGIQIYVEKSMWQRMFGQDENERRCVRTLYSVLDDKYGGKVPALMPVSDPVGSMTWFRDEETIAALIHETKSDPEITFRIFNRDHWNLTDERMMSMQQVHIERYG